MLYNIIIILFIFFNKVKSDSNVPQKSLAWKVKELETLGDNIRQLVVDIKMQDSPQMVNQSSWFN